LRSILFSVQFWTSKIGKTPKKVNVWYKKSLSHRPVANADYSAEFLQTDLMTTLRWMRAFGDTIFAAGIVALVVFVAQLTLDKGKWMK